MTTTPALPRRQRQLLRGGAGGKANADLAAEFGIASNTVRRYGKDVLVGCASQAVVVGVLAGLVLLSDIDPAWPAEPLASAAELRSAVL